MNEGGDGCARVEAVQREHIGFLRELLAGRQEYWRDRAERWQAEVEQLREANARLRASLAEAAMLVQDLEAANKAGVELEVATEETTARWATLCHGRDL
jgi:phage shock protein A